MNNRHACHWMIPILLLWGTAAFSPGAESPASPPSSDSLAPAPQPEPVRESAQSTDPQTLAAILVMFIPWCEPTPTPPLPGGGNNQNDGGGNNQNNGGGGNTQGTGGGNTQGSGGGNTQGSGGSTDPGGSIHLGGGNTGGNTGGSGDPSDPGLGGGVTHSNPEPATVVTTLIGTGLLGLAGLRRRRWALR